jgi:hypothetical protein
MRTPLLARAATFIEAFVELLWLDICGAFGFRHLHSAVARQRTSPGSSQPDALALVRVAVRDACIFYPTPVLCLQRSAAVTRMLRRRGLAADLVIGYQSMPVEGHAWVELDKSIVWDNFSRVRFFRVLTRI